MDELLDRAKNGWGRWEYKTTETKVDEKELAQMLEPVLQRIVEQRVKKAVKEELEYIKEEMQTAEVLVNCARGAERLEEYDPVANMLVAMVQAKQMLGEVDEEVERREQAGEAPMKGVLEYRLSVMLQEMQETYLHMIVWDRLKEEL